MRIGKIERRTNETDISLTLSLDGSGIVDIKTDCGFLGHMLTLFAAHGGFDLTLRCTGDAKVDYHHTVEDVGICLGRAFAQAIGDKKGITRYGDRLLPMDETLILSAVDISGRGGLFMDIELTKEKVGDFDTELVEEFFIAFTRNAGVTLHIKQMSGKNTHHIIEGIFKSVARALSAASRIDEANAGILPSTKGVL
ncbi:MAG: imidazoleglycerol-phosphate dehydratase HisB [Clostridia bacterium]|nr:imidazoleglycerol-phosphate dehydratase HisB [Clostridia bacterium]